MPRGRLDPARAILYVWAAIAVVVLGYAALHRLSRDDAGRRFASIAVLPFENLGGSRENEYFSDGISHSIMAQLTMLRDLKVIGHSSSALYKDVRKPPGEIARELGVATILQGNVWREENQMRVVASLIDARSGGQLWAESYDRALHDIFAIQSDLVQQVAHQLLARIPNSARARMQQQPTHDLAAYDLFLRGRWFSNQRSHEGLAQALDLFEQASARDSAFALAHAGIAGVYVARAYYGLTPLGDDLERGHDAAERAVRLDPELGEAHAALGYLQWQQWDWDGADASFRRALQLNPGYATAHRWYGLFLAAWGKTELAEARMARALQLDPFSLAINAELGLVRFYTRRYEEAIAQFQRTLDMDSTLGVAYSFLAGAYVQTGRYNDALAAQDQAHRYGPTLQPRSEELRRVFARHPTAENYYRLSIAEGPAPEEGGALHLAYWNAGLGNTDAAIANLDLALRNREMFVAFIAVQPAFDGLRDDPRFQELLRRMNLR